MTLDDWLEVVAMPHLRRFEKAVDYYARLREGHAGKDECEIDIEELRRALGYLMAGLTGDDSFIPEINYDDCEPTPPDSVYIFAGEREDSRIKVGLSNNPQTRLRSAQTTSPERLHIVDAVEYPDGCGWWVESLIHEKGKEAGFHVHGEWFTAEFLATAKRMVKQKRQNVAAYEKWRKENGLDNEC